MCPLGSGGVHSGAPKVLEFRDYKENKQLNKILLATALDGVGGEGQKGRRLVGGSYALGAPALEAMSPLWPGRGNAGPARGRGAQEWVYPMQTRESRRATTAQPCSGRSESAQEGR